MRRIRRSRAVLLSTFVAPLAFTVIVVFALGGSTEPRMVEVGVVATSSSPLVSAAIEQMTSSDELVGLVEWERPASESAATEAVREQELGAAILVGVVDDEIELTVIGGEDPIADGLASTIADEVAVESAAVALGVPASDRTDVAKRLVVTMPGGRSLEPAVYWGPALGIFFILLSLGHAASRHVDDVRRQVAHRVTATVGSVTAVGFGRALVAGALGTASLLTMALGTQLLFGRAWGSWPQVVVVAAASGLAAAGIGSLVAAIARTPAQAQSLSAIAAFVLGIGGGTFSPPGSVAVAGQFTRWFPSTLALDAFTVVVTTGRSSGLAAPVSALVAIGVALFAVAAFVSDARRLT